MGTSCAMVIGLRTARAGPRIRLRRPSTSAADLEPGRQAAASAVAHSPLPSRGPHSKDQADQTDDEENRQRLHAPEWIAWPVPLLSLADTIPQVICKFSERHVTFGKFVRPWKVY
jgi:hypothetical protein